MRFHAGSGALQGQVGRFHCRPQIVPFPFRSRFSTLETDLSVAAIDADAALREPEQLLAGV